MDITDAQLDEWRMGSLLLVVLVIWLAGVVDGAGPAARAASAPPALAPQGDIELEPVFAYSALRGGCPAGNLHVFATTLLVLLPLRWRG